MKARRMRGGRRPEGSADAEWAGPERLEGTRRTWAAGLGWAVWAPQSPLRRAGGGGGWPKDVTEGLPAASGRCSRSWARRP